MKEVFLIYCIISTYSVVLGTSDDYEYDEEEGNTIGGNDNKFVSSNCWMTLNAPQLFKVMDEIDERYAKVRNQIQESLMATNFDETMVNGFVSSKGAALREVHAFNKRAWMIPSGMNLGGYCMMRMPDSVLFFHRMKLRNNTYFRIDGLHNDLANMQVRINLALNDLHLKGAYERSLTDNDASILIYAPTFGQVEFLLKDVRYKMEGRYRLIKNRLIIELISSEIFADDVLMTYINQAIKKSTKKIDQANLDNFLDRLKTDLDEWLKDYFNDYMIHADMDGIANIDELSKYDKEKATALEEYTDSAIDAIATRLRQLNAKTIQLPMFTFKSIHGLQIKLYDGVLRGLDSMYRRSVATGLKQRDVRKVDAVVGFSNLKVVYKYEAVLPTGIPPLAGVLTLSANELTAHLALSMVVNPESIDLEIEFLDQMKPESLTIEGAANVMISNFKHLLEHQIVAVMSNTLMHGIAILKSLPSCVPFVPGQIAGKEKSFDENSDHLTDYLSAIDTDLSTDMNGDEYKAALRSTKKPTTTSVINKSNKTDKKKNPQKVKKYKLRNKKRNNYKRKQEI